MRVCMCVCACVCVCVCVCTPEPLHKIAVMGTAWFGQPRGRAEDKYGEERKAKILS